jgi:DNA polymerase sigma
MNKDAGFTKCISSQEKSGLFIVKMELTKKFENFRVEIIFRIFNSLTFPRNEDVISEYIGLYPHSRPLYLIVRSLLHNAKLDNPSSFGINNFSLFLLIIAFCQKFHQLNNFDKKETNCQIEEKTHANNCHINIKNISINNERKAISKDYLTTQEIISNDFNTNADSHRSAYYKNLGDLVIKFFYFFGYSFDYANTYICPFLPSDHIKESFFQVRLKENRLPIAFACYFKSLSKTSHPDKDIQEVP